MAKKYSLQPNPREIEIRQGDEIFVSVLVGNGQIGGNIIRLNGEILAKGDLTDPTFLGDSNKLGGKEIILTTNVLDVNPFTNMCVITTQFLNQHNQQLYSRIDKGEAEEDDIASFKGNYYFKVLSILLCFFVFGKIGFAQSTNLAQFEELQTPSSPGLILLDNAPSSIERPTTPQGFGASLLGFFNGKGGAVEVNPFWLTTHANLTAKKLTEKKVPILEYLSVSGATVDYDSLSYLSLGLRTRLLNISSKDQVKKQDSIRQLIILELSTDLEDMDMDRVKELQVAYGSLVTKPIFSIDLAGAFAGSSINNSFDSLSSSRWGAWMNLNYRPKGNNFYITTLVRFYQNESFEEYNRNSSSIDIGTRLNYDIGSFSLSGEYLQRINLSPSGNDNRVALIGNYQISPNFYLTSTFGKNFSSSNNIIALLGINFGFSTNKMKAY